MVNWHLLPGEKKIHETTMSRKVFLKIYIISIALFILAIISAVASDILPISIPTGYAAPVFILASVIAFMMGDMKKKKEMILITTDRVLVRKNDPSNGINIEAIPYDKLTNVRVSQSRKQRYLNIGDVIFVVMGQEHVLKDIDSPYRIEKAVYRIIEKDKQFHRLPQ